LTGTIWEAALTITNGDADYGSSTNWSKHFRPRNAVIAFNTFVNNLHNIEIGYTNNGNYTKPPSNNLIANNVIQGSVNELIHIYTQPTSMIWESNIMFPTDNAVLGFTASYEQIKQVDPLLTEIDSLWFISSNSPAIDSATGVYDYVLDDFNGQQRISLKDIGADEYSIHSIIRKPLTANDVGPFAEEIVTSVETGFNSKNNTSSYILYQNHPNPFNPSTKISYSIPQYSFVMIKVYDIIGNEVETLVNQTQSAGSYNIDFKVSQISSGIYFYQFKAGNYIQTKKMAIIK
jgi:poly(beta-D-mannuronate) lyase